jgi:hypothetical protein
MGLTSLKTEILAHTMVIGEHAFISAQIEFIIILGELAKTDCGVLVDDASDLHLGAGLHLFWITLELDYLYLSVYKERNIYQNHFVFSA